MQTIIVTGDRHATVETWERVVAHALFPFMARHQAVLLHGAARGIDTIAADVWTAWDRMAIPFPALWRQLGHAAGPRRNEVMLAVGRYFRAYGHDVQVFAFHDGLDDSKGTKHMVKVARADQFRVTLFRSDSTSEVL